MKFIGEYIISQELSENINTSELDINFTTKEFYHI